MQFYCTAATYVMRNKSPCRIQAQGVTTLAHYYTFATGTAGALWYKTM